MRFRSVIFNLIAGMLAFLAVDTCLAADSDAKKGYVVDVPVPLGADSTSNVLLQLERLAKSVPEGERITVVLRYAKDAAGGESTPFEDALKLARALTGSDLRALKIASYVQGTVNGHSVLPILASDTVILAPGAILTDASAAESAPDETIVLSYRSIAARRGLFPPAIVTALVDPGAELAWVSKTSGGQVFATGDELKELRSSGDVLSEEVWSASGSSLKIEAEQLRSTKIAAGIVDSLEGVAEILDLAETSIIDDTAVAGEAKGVMLDISGAISSSRVRRWQSNLDATLAGGDINTWILSIDSSGGDFDESALLAATFASPSPPLRSVAGLIENEARGDAALIAMACKPLLMKADATLGGPGQDTISVGELDNYRELIDQIAVSAKRPPALVRGLLCRDLEVYRFTNKKTGRVKYATKEGLVSESDEPDLERDRWDQGELIDLTIGLSADKAIELGLADGRSDSLDDTSRRMGLAGTPPPVTDRGVVRWVERLGRSQGLMFLLLVVGFITLSSEANAPGMGVPGFISLVCFGLYFWMKYLAGTAEWLELVLFFLGIICIAIEVLVIPGFGVFGIGGLAMTILAIVLMSQTFVIPKNTYQIEVLTRGLWVAIGGTMGLFGGFLLMRWLFPHVPLFNALVMETPDAAAVNEAEKLVDFNHLLGKTGNTTTPLRPSGKARFGDEIIQVVSDGTMVDSGVEIRVLEVLGSRVIVEPIT
ncbi:NfeD family protein [Stieleria varia]|uniref:Uncharacterized protein n=1 Tax=Stieleria varia TaxID=2528005 RepID=A0A5C6AT18_9BACT|nr:NfeD family protein [Stieleria varia]TWU02698.1 hypothetical protein Pla52n_37560 [Stieleria varia]